MAISFRCGCGKLLRARDDQAGKKARCPQCSAIVTAPGPAADVAVEAMAQAALGPPRARYGAAPTCSTYRGEEPAPTAWAPTPEAPRRPKATAPAPAAAASAAKRPGDSSLLEYSYLLLVLALIPLMFSLL